MTCPETPTAALSAAVAAAGSQTSFARICGVSQSAVWKWLRGNKALPSEHVLDVEAVTGISRHELRPDIYPLDDDADRRRRLSIARAADQVAFDRAANSKAPR